MSVDSIVAGIHKVMRQLDQRQALLEVCKKVDARWTAGNFSHDSKLWAELLAATEAAQQEDKG